MRDASDNKREAKITGREGVTAINNLQQIQLDLDAWMNHTVDCNYEDNPSKISRHIHSKLHKTLIHPYIQVVEK